MKADTLGKETAISDLNAFPMRFASEETRALLEKRGREFWTCREKRLVSYYDKDGMYGVSAFLKNESELEETLNINHCVECGAVHGRLPHL